MEMDIPSGKLTVCELENGHRNGGFTHGKWWIFHDLSIVMWQCGCLPEGTCLYALYAMLKHSQYSL